VARHLSALPLIAQRSSAALRAKVLMLARDRDIRHPTMLKQLRR
jgi:hypothetical protein